MAVKTNTDRIEKLEKDVKALNTRLKELESNKFQLPSSKDLDETRGKVMRWAQENPMAALGIAIVIGMIVGMILS